MSMAKNRPQKDSADKQEDGEEIRYTKDWRDEHGQPDFAYLQALEADGSIEALEKLKSIAEDLDVEYDPAVPPGELIERIRTAVAENEDENTQPTT